MPAPTPAASSTRFRRAGGDRAEEGVVASRLRSQPSASNASNAADPRLAMLDMALILGRRPFADLLVRVVGPGQPSRSRSGPSTEAMIRARHWSAWRACLALGDELAGRDGGPVPPAPRTRTSRPAEQPPGARSRPLTARPGDGPAPGREGGGRARRTSARRTDRPWPRRRLPRPARRRDRRRRGAAARAPSGSGSRTRNRAYSASANRASASSGMRAAWSGSPRWRWSVARLSRVWICGSATPAPDAPRVISRLSSSASSAISTNPRSNSSEARVFGTRPCTTASSPRPIVPTSSRAASASP